jgi:hypothetical protein
MDARNLCRAMSIFLCAEKILKKDWQPAADEGILGPAGQERDGAWKRPGWRRPLLEPVKSGL